MVLTMSDRRSDVDGWNSLTHVKLVAIELEKRIKFSIANVQSFKTLETS
jgi:acyl carrier protein